MVKGNGGELIAIEVDFDIESWLVPKGASNFHVYDLFEDSCC